MAGAPRRARTDILVRRIVNGRSGRAALRTRGLHLRLPAQGHQRPGLHLQPELTRGREALGQAVLQASGGPRSRVAVRRRDAKGHPHAGRAVDVVGDAARRDEGHGDQARVGGLALVGALVAADAAAELAARRPAGRVALQRSVPEAVHRAPVGARAPPLLAGQEVAGVARVRQVLRRRGRLRRVARLALRALGDGAAHRPRAHLVLRHTREGRAVELVRVAPVGTRLVHLYLGHLVRLALDRAALHHRIHPWRLWLDCRDRRVCLWLWRQHATPAAAEPGRSSSRSTRGVAHRGQLAREEEDEIGALLGAACCAINGRRHPDAALVVNAQRDHPTSVVRRGRIGLQIQSGAVKSLLFSSTRVDCESSAYSILCGLRPEVGTETHFRPPPGCCVSPKNVRSKSSRALVSCVTLSINVKMNSGPIELTPLSGAPRLSTPTLCARSVPRMPLWLGSLAE
eukprot:scaffold126923_cov60-Phaeocystis_antarctica.AAC.2